MYDTEKKYPQLGGDLRYMADRTKPDLRFISGKLGCAMHRPTAPHWLAMKAVMRYIEATAHNSITSTAGQRREPTLAILKGLCHASFGGDHVDRKSMSGHVQW